jgi:hypothetical protein
MNMNKNSTIQNTARLGVCFLIGAAAFAACGQVKEDQASSSPVVAPAASTIQSSVAFDRQSSVELASDHALAPTYLSAADARIALMEPTVYVSAADARIALMKPTTYLSAGDARIAETFGYVSPEQLDKQAQLEVAAAHALSDNEG